LGFEKGFELHQNNFTAILHSCGYSTYW